MDKHYVKQAFEAEFFPTAGMAKKLIEPLNRELGVAAFAQVRINSQGEYRAAVSCPEWHELYLAEELYWHDPFWRAPKLFESGATLFNAKQVNHYQDARRQLGLGTSLNLITRHKDSVQITAISLNANRHPDPNLLVRELPILRRFASYAGGQMEPMFSRQKGLNLPSVIGERFNAPTGMGKRARRLRLLQAIGAPVSEQQVSRLTPKERETLQVLSEGHTMVGIAAHMKLSSRTVEHYLDSCKMKLESESLPELRRLACLLSELELL